MDTKRLVGIADELYSLDPAEFTAARNAKAKQSDAELATAVRALRKPSAAAWMTNLLARERPADLDAAIALGESLREAQDEGDRDRLVSLGAQRRKAITALAVTAGQLAQAHGQKAGASALAEVRETVQAALGDPRAAALVRSGRLVRSLVAGDDLVDAAALADEITVAPPAPRPKKPAADRARLRREAERAEAADAEAAAAQKKADAAAKVATRDSDRIAAELRRLDEAARAKRAERDAASDLLAAAKAEADALAADARSAHTEAVRARRRAEAD